MKLVVQILMTGLAAFLTEGFGDYACILLEEARDSLKLCDGEDRTLSLICSRILNSADYSCDEEKSSLANSLARNVLLLLTNVRIAESFHVMEKEVMSCIE